MWSGSRTEDRSASATPSPDRSGSLPRLRRREHEMSGLDVPRFAAAHRVWSGGRGLGLRYSGHRDAAVEAAQLLRDRARATGEPVLAAWGSYLLAEALLEDEAEREAGPATTRPVEAPGRCHTSVPACATTAPFRRRPIATRPGSRSAAPTTCRSHRCSPRVIRAVPARRAGPRRCAAAPDRRAAGADPPRTIHRSGPWPGRARAARSSCPSSRTRRGPCPGVRGHRGRRAPSFASGARRGHGGRRPVRRSRAGVERRADCEEHDRGPPGRGPIDGGGHRKRRRTCHRQGHPHAHGRGLAHPGAQDRHRPCGRLAGALRRPSSGRRGPPACRQPAVDLPEHVFLPGIRGLHHLAAGSW